MNSIVNKILVKIVESVIMTFYLGIGSIIISSILILIFRINIIFDMGFIIMCMCCGLFNFFGMYINLNDLKSNNLILI